MIWRIWLRGWILSRISTRHGVADKRIGNILVRLVAVFGGLKLFPVDVMSWPPILAGSGMAGAV